MCDTFVALAGATANGEVLFAKNSDREPNEPHVILRVPRKKHTCGTMLKCTYIEVPQVVETFDVILFKPSWIWGAEMGVNEYGLTIGNEAVFTKEKQGPPALLGMDILRIALERCQNAGAALDLIIYLLEKYGQGGKCGFTENLKYDNAFLIADNNTAFVMETAGRQWVVKEVHDVRGISNSLSIERDFDRASENLIQNAVKKGWARSAGDFDFKKSYEKALFAHFSCGDYRRKIVENSLKSRLGKLALQDMKDILRQHHEDCCGREFATGSMKSICMHAGGLISSQTTGSFIVELFKGSIKILATGSSLPCVSIFKPIWFTQGDNSLLDGNTGFWGKREMVNRMFLENRISNMDEFLDKKNSLELDLETRAKEAVTDEEKIETMKYAFKEEHKLLNQVINKNMDNKPFIKGGLYFKHYWKKQNSRIKSLFLNSQTMDCHDTQ
ncbi:MAG: peptidase U34 [Bacillota bacterium]